MPRKLVLKLRNGERLEYPNFGAHEDVMVSRIVTSARDHDPSVHKAWQELDGKKVVSTFVPTVRQRMLGEQDWS